MPDTADEQQRPGGAGSDRDHDGVDDQRRDTLPAFRPIAESGAWLASSEGWQCAEREVRLDAWDVLPLYRERGDCGNVSKVSSASQLGIEERRQRIIAHAFREYGIIRRLFPPDINGQMTIPLA